MKLILKTGLLAAIAFALVGSTARADVYNGTLTANACEAGKAKCVTKMNSCLLGCYGKAVGKGGAADPACLDKCRGGFFGDPAIGKGCIEKLETKGGCGASAGDGPVLKSKVEARASDVYQGMVPARSSVVNKCTAGKLKCVTKYDACVLGIVGKALKAGGPVGDLSKCTAILVGAKSCTLKLELKNPIGSATQCTSFGDGGLFKSGGDAYVNDILYDFISGPHNLNTQRCNGNTSVTCTSAPGGGAGCGGALGTCEFFFGSELPLSAGGVASCVVTQWNGAIAGTFNQADGSAAGSAKVVSKVYLGVSATQPCPRCVGGNGIPNDGLGLGTCDAGARSGLACDENGESPVPAFGKTSLDCPPTAGALVGTLPVDLTNTNTGTVTRTLSASSPNCNGEPGHKCMCSSCSLNSSIPCFTDADCAAASAGTCTNNAGNPRQTNACIDDTTTPGSECTTLPGGGGACAGGPIDSHCTVETFRGCLVDSDCSPGDTCGSAPRRCFAGYTGLVGDTITAAAAHSLPHNHTNESNFASLFCVAPTSSSAINGAAGLPGPGRLQLAGVSTENGVNTGEGTPVCPTVADFLPTSTGGALDSGWTGLAHAAQAVGQGKVSVAATCTGNPATNSCTCTYSGPIANP